MHTFKCNYKSFGQIFESYQKQKKLKFFARDWTRVPSDHKQPLYQQSYEDNLKNRQKFGHIFSGKYDLLQVDKYLVKILIHVLPI